MVSKKLSKGEKLARKLVQPKLGDYDPENIEEDGFASDRSEDGSEREDIEVDQYEELGRGLLRRGEILDDPRYQGKIVSREDLSDEGDGDADDDDDEEVDPAAYANVEYAYEQETDDDEDHMEEDEYGAPTEHGTFGRDGEEQDLLDEELAILAEEEKEQAQQLQDAAAEDAEKGKHVREQLSFYETAMHMRIKLQSPLQQIQKLPAPEVLRLLREGTSAIQKQAGPIREGLQDLRSSLTGLLSDIVDIQRLLLSSKEETKALANPLNKLHGDLDEGSSIQDLHTASRNFHKRFGAWRDDTLDTWHRQIQVKSGSMALRGRKFSALDRPPSEQISALLLDRERVMLRSQMRTQAALLRPRSQSKSNSDIKDHTNSGDGEVYIDNEFYHNLLRSFIANRSDKSKMEQRIAEQMQSVDQELRKQKRKRQDPKASKGKRVRYDTHEKLVGFMAPLDAGMIEDDRHSIVQSIFGGAMVSRLAEVSSYHRQNGKVNEEEDVTVDNGVKLFG
eukprot:Clim_evm63s147 gene=Clim_evmTU63s147